MITVETGRPDAGAVIKAEGGLTVDSASELKRALADALQGSGRVSLNVAWVTEADISCIQLLCSACKSACAAGKAFTLTGASEAIARVARSAAVCRRVGCPPTGEVRCFWSMGGEHG